MKRLRWMTFILLLVFAFVGQTLAAPQTLLPTHDTTADPFNALQNLDGESLMIAYSSFDGADFRATNTTFLQFDLSQIDQSLNRSELMLTIMENALLADDAVVALYAVDDDWTAATLTAGNAPTLPSSPFATTTIKPDSTQIIFGSQTSASAFADQLERERQGDGIASYVLRIDAVTDGRFGGALLLGESGSPLGPEIKVGQGVPTAVGLISAEIPTLSNLALIGAFLLLLPTIWQAHPSVVAPIRRGHRGNWRKRLRRLNWFGIYIAPLLIVGSTVFAVKTTHAQTCDAVTPDFTLSAFADDAELMWTDDPANKLGYKIWRTVDEATISIEDAPYATLPAGSNHFLDEDVLKNAGTVYNYTIAGVSSCGDSLPAATQGAKQFELNTTDGAYTFITIPFSNGIQSAFDLYSYVYGARAVMKWDIERGAFRIFVPPFGGDNFLIEPGDTLLIAAGAGMLPNITFTGEHVARDYEMLEDVQNLMSVPAQVGTIDSAESLLDQTPQFKTVQRWNAATQQFETYTRDGRSPNFLIRPHDPLVIQLSLPDIQNFFVWPEDEGVVVWSQREQNGAREVYVHWQDGNYSADSQYTVMRRPLDDDAEAVSFNVKRGNFADFQQLVPADVMDDLKVQLGAESVQDLYDRLSADNDLVRLIANNHHEVAIAFGLGYLDSDALAGSTLYTVLPAAGGARIGEICADHNNDFAPLNLRAIDPFAIPDGLGERPSPRPFNAAERFDWGSSQRWRTQDGRVFLDWDTLPEEQNPLRCAGREQERLAGYHVYRNGLMTDGMEPFDATPSGNPTRISVGSQAENDPNRSDDNYLMEGAEPYLLEDDIKTNFPDFPLQQVYVPLDYRVCKVDYLGTEHACELLAKVPVRELIPPMPPTDLSAEMNTANTVLTLDWNHDTAAEASEPVRYYVSYSRDPHLPADQWQDLIFAGLQNSAVSFGNPLDEVNVTLWYRVQVRDNAGNWSAASPPVSATFADRIAPEPPSSADVNDCEAGRLPINLTLADADVVSVRVYRQLLRDETTPISPAQFITTIPVAADGTAIFDEEDYRPPVNISARYSLQAVDGNGNQSELSDHCVLLDSGEKPQPPPVTISIDPKVTTGKTIIIIWVDDGDIPPGTRVSIWVPGYDEPFTGTVNPDGSITYDDPTASEIIDETLENGGSVRVAVYTVTPFGVEGFPTIDIIGPGNPTDFEREFANLGALKLVTWEDPDNGDPYVRVQITDKLTCPDCDDYPFVALFRRAEYGNWLQVSSFIDMATLVNNIGIEMVIEDHSDLSHNESYEYKVLAFGKNKLELVGVYDSWVLEPFDDTAHVFDMGGALDAAPHIPNCGKISEAPSNAGLPAQIVAPNGWKVVVTDYWKDAGDGCFPIDFEHADVNGVGKVAIGSNDYVVQFAGLKIDPTTGALIAGRIVFVTDGLEVVLANQLVMTVSRIELTETGSSAEFILPTAVNFMQKGSPDKRGNTFTGVVNDFTSNFQFTPRGRTDLWFVDENLPWLAMPDVTLVTPNGVELREIKVTYRLPMPVQAEQNGVIVADNNLGFMAVEYTTAVAQVDKYGLSGVFNSAENSTYSTSMPAAFAITFKGATLVLENGGIINGELQNATAMVDYFPNHVEFELLLPSSDFRPPRLRHLIEVNDMTLKRLTIFGEAGVLQLGQAGRIYHPVFTAEQPSWLSFTSLHAEADLMIAPVSVNTDPELVVWARHDNNDPGLNITRSADVNDTDSLAYSCFVSDQFDAALDLYLRRGGMSRTFALTPDASLDRTMNDFVVKIEGMNGAFLDNYMRGDLDMALILPYPSDIEAKMQIDGFDPSGCAADGTLESGMVYHDYWDLSQYLKGDARFVNTDPELYGDDNPYAKVVQFSGTALVRGMSYHGSTADEVYVPLQTAWLPNGDAGQSKIMDSESYWLTAGRSADLIESSFPFTPTGQINGLEQSLQNIIIAPRYSKPGDVTSLPNMLGLDMAALRAVYGLAEGEISAETINACAQQQQAGCGFLVIDGELAIDQLGALKPTIEDLDDMVAAYLPVGSSPTAILNYAGDYLKDFITDPGIAWDWQTRNGGVNDLQYGMRLQVHPEGGALVGVFKDFNFLPEQHGIEQLALLHGDIGYAITFDFAEVDTIDDVGIFVGYAAVPAAVRALAMNLPDFQSENATRPYQNYDDIRADVADWLAVFHYDELADNHAVCGDARQTPQQLIEAIWADWAEDGISQTFTLVEPKIDGLAGRSCYGLSPLDSGDLLQSKASTSLDGIAGQVVINSADFFDFTFEELAMGTHFLLTGHDDFLEVDFTLLEAAWLGASYNRDGLLHAYGQGVETDLIALSLIPGLGPVADFDVQVKFDDDNNVERTEGGVHVENLELVLLSFPHLNGVFGSGNYTLENNETIKIDYFGADVEAVFNAFGDDLLDVSSYPLGGRILMGEINVSPNSPLAAFGFGDLLGKFGNADPTAPNIRDGWYVNVYGTFPILELGVLEVSAAAEVALWDFSSSRGESTGGTLIGSAHAKLAYVLSGKGALALTMEEVARGDQINTGWGGALDQVCPDDQADGCFAFTGEFWIASGVGWCSPRTWRHWNRRWWRDSWCYQVGAVVGMSYLDDGDDSNNDWVADYAVDWE